jgi:hypothetical protein
MFCFNKVVMVFALLVLVAPAAAAGQGAASVRHYEVYEAAIAELFTLQQPLALGEVRIEFVSDGEKPEMQVRFRQDPVRDNAWTVEVWSRVVGAGSIFSELNARYAPTQPISVQDVVSWANVRRSQHEVESDDSLAKVLSSWTRLTLPLELDTTLFTDSASFRVQMRSGSLTVAAELTGARTNDPTKDEVVLWLRSLRLEVERVLSASTQ